jgi:uncharacterized membrane protein
MIEPGVDVAPQMLGVAALLLLGALVLAHLTERMRLPSEIRLLAWAGFVGYTVVGSILLVLLTLGSSDALAYHQQASEISKFLTGEEAQRPLLTAGKEGWVWLLGGVYTLTMPAPLVGVALNACFLAIALCLAYQLAYEVSGSSATGGRVAAWLFLASPGHWFWGTLPLREASVGLSCSVIALYVYRASRGQTCWIPLMAGFAALAALRASLAVLVGATIGLVYFISTLTSRASFGRRVSALLLGALLIGVAVGASESVANEMTFYRIEAIRSSQSAEASTGFDTGQGPHKVGLVATTVSSLSRVVLGPLPWELPSVVPLIPFAIYWYFVIFLLLRALSKRQHRTALWVLLAPAAALMLALALYSGNYGTMVRLREETLAFLMPLIALGWAPAQALTGITPDRQLGDLERRPRVHACRLPRSQRW